MCWFVVVLYTFVSYCFFFFFKQKTAYEMRISDWSSDVCSSDLERRLRVPAARLRHQGGPRAAARLVARCPRRGPDADFGGALEIGRASCRERVCQYV